MNGITVYALGVVLEILPIKGIAMNVLNVKEPVLSLSTSLVWLGQKCPVFGHFLYFIRLITGPVQTEPTTQSIPVLRTFVLCIVSLRHFFNSVSVLRNSITTNTEDICLTTFLTSEMDTLLLFKSNS